MGQRAVIEKTVAALAQFKIGLWDALRDPVCFNNMEVKEPLANGTDENEDWRECAGVASGAGSF